MEALGLGCPGTTVVRQTCLATGMSTLKLEVEGLLIGIIFLVFNSLHPIAYVHHAS